MGEWRLVEHARPAFAVELPGAPFEVVDDGDAGSLNIHVAERAYIVTWTGAAATRWLPLQRGAVVDGYPILEDTVVSDHELRLVVVRERDVIQTTRLVVHGGVGYIVVAMAPVRNDPDVERFLASFSPR